MFNSEFYPTPDDLIRELTAGIYFTCGLSILEPSAGKGNILDFITQRITKPYNYDRNAWDIDCIESDPDLQNILVGNKYRVVFDDFLRFKTYKHYDFIIMNPPFSNGDEHLLKAISIAEQSGSQIRCILNAETLKNPYTNRRKLLVQKLEEYGAEIQYVENAFKNAERKTDVEIALVFIKIPAPELRESLILDDLKKAVKAEEAERTAEESDIITSDFIKGIVQRYNFEVRLGINLIKEFRKVSKQLTKGFDKDYKDSPIFCLTLNDYIEYHSANPATVNNFLKYVRAKYWNALFENKEFTGLMTTNILSQFKKRVEELVDYDFNEYNIYTIKLQMIKNCQQGIDDTILKLFERFSNKYSYYDECSSSIHYFNGWKTNKSYIVNKKVIIPCRLYLNRSYYMNEKYERIDYSYIDGEVDSIIDAEKVFNYLDGGNTDFDDLKTVLNIAANNKKTKNIECKYFFLTFYKKGTCHITFKDEKLLKKFNLFGSQRKGWLPPTYAKKSYKDMDAEEKAVIDEFEGKESYEETIQHLDYYIQDSGKLLMLTD